MSYPIYVPRIGNQIAELIDDAVSHAEDKHPNSFTSCHEAASIIREEYEEFWDIVKTDGSKEDMEKELVQIAATAIRAIKMLRQNK